MISLKRVAGGGILAPDERKAAPKPINFVNGIFHFAKDGARSVPVKFKRRRHYMVPA